MSRFQMAYDTLKGAGEIGESVLWGLTKLGLHWGPFSDQFYESHLSF